MIYYSVESSPVIIYKAFAKKKSIVYYTAIYYIDVYVLHYIIHCIMKIFYVDTLID